MIEPKVRELIAESPHASDYGTGHADVGRNRCGQDLSASRSSDLGFHEVGFAPVTTSPNQLYAINTRGMDQVLEAVPPLAGGVPANMRCAARCTGSQRQRHAGRTSPGREQIASLRRGLGLMGVGPSGDIAPCHRFVDSDTTRAGPHRYRHRPRKASRFSQIEAISIPSTIAIPAGRDRCAPAAVITRHSCDTGTRVIRTCTTAIGFAIGPIRV